MIEQHRGFALRFRRDALGTLTLKRLARLACGARGSGGSSAGAGAIASAGRGGAGARTAGGAAATEGEDALEFIQMRAQFGNFVILELEGALHLLDLHLLGLYDLEKALLLWRGRHVRIVAHHERGIDHAHRRGRG